MSDDLFIVGPSRATLPNCDQCGQFTGRPTFVHESFHSGRLRMCGTLLLCPRCAADRTPPDPATAGSFHARERRA